MDFKIDQRSINVGSEKLLRCLIRHMCDTGVHLLTYITPTPTPTHTHVLCVAKLKPANTWKHKTDLSYVLWVLARRQRTSSLRPQYARERCYSSASAACVTAGACKTRFRWSRGREKSPNASKVCTRENMLMGCLSFIVFFIIITFDSL